MNVMTHEEAKELKTLEKVIERGMSTFIEVGNALKAIRDSKLYREQYKTFDRYVQERWAMQKAHAYRLIESAEVSENLSPIGDKKQLPSTESQARELAKAPPEKQAEVWQEVVETTPNPTAKDVKAVVEKHKLYQQEAIKSPKCLSVSIVKDSINRDVPDSLRGKYAVAAILSAIGRKLDGIKREVVELADEEGGWFIPVQEVELACKELKDKITDAGYWTACPRCKGKGCKRCDSSGFVPKSRKNMLSADDKELLGL